MSRNALLLSLFVLSMAACSAPLPDEQEQAVAQAKQRARQQASATAEVAQPVDATACEPTQAQWIVGKAPSSAEVAQAKGDARATSVRLLKPDQAMTMDFNAARLNIELDEKGLVASVRCG